MNVFCSTRMTKKKTLTSAHEKYMCMSTAHNVLEALKLLKIIGRDMFFNQLCIMVMYSFKTKDVTELEKRSILGHLQLSF